MNTEDYIKISRNKRRISRRRKKEMVVLVLLLLIVFLGLILYFGGKFYGNKKANDKISKPYTDAKMNSRESKINNEEISTDSSIKNVYNSDGHKIAYLTFDDGPSASTTPRILNTLDKYNVKATFFIIGDMAITNPNLVKMEANDGQSIGNHTYSHNYKKIYSNPNAFIGDINRCQAVLKSILGNNFNSRLVRFPGGSFGTRLEPFRKALKNAGYHYIDWNDLTGDAEGQNIPVDKLLSNLKKYTSGKDHVVILMHDAPDKVTTVQALPQAIEYLKTQGYSFGTIK